MLHDCAIISLLAGALCAFIIACDLVRRPQHMWIMNVVWPVTALFGTVALLWAYLVHGRATPHESAAGENSTPFAIMVGKGTLHCGAGCALGDICAEWLAFAVPGVAVVTGWRWLFDEKMFALWILDYVFAYAFGIVFQYFTIAPMRKLSLGAGLRAAVKADTISITAWQIGMYGVMAAAHFYFFPHWVGTTLETVSAEFWFMMQIAMVAGFMTSYPANWWLLRVGIKEKM